jgi:hypothetical protein
MLQSPQTLKSKITSSLINWLKRDWLVLLLYLIATIIMTYPVAFRLGGSWVASRDVDTYVKLWDQWWFGRALSLGLPINHTTDLFFPIGLDFTYHSISWGATVLMWLVTPIFGAIGAYNFSILFAVFSTAYGGYLLIRSIALHRSAAWLGGAVYSFIPYHIQHTGGHPDLVHLAAIPIAVWLFTRAIQKRSCLTAIAAAVMIGSVAFTSLYLIIFASMTLIPIFIYLAFEQQRWRTLGFWKVAIVFGIACALFVGPRVLPLVQSSDALADAIEGKFSANTLQTDLLAFVIPSRFNPIFKSVVEPIANRFEMNRKWPAYLGIVAIVMWGSALTWKKNRKLTWTWALLGLFFAVMALGPVLRFNGKIYNDIKLPLAYLEWFPPIRAVARPDYFMLALILPLAVVTGIGADRWLLALDRHRRAKIIFTIGVAVFMLFEYWSGVYPGFDTIPNPFYTQVANEPGKFALIDLPMGRFNSKEYIYDQITHQRPIVEGLIGRTPPEAYAYIDNNPLLDRWQAGAPLDCSEIDAATLKQSLDQLAADNFRYVIVHHSDGRVPDAFAGYLTSAPVYHDDSITAYSISDLQANQPCEGH